VVETGLVPRAVRDLVAGLARRREARGRVVRLLRPVV